MGETRILFLFLLPLASACSGSPAEREEKVPGAPPPNPPAAWSISAAPTVAALGTFYVGELGGTLPVRLCLRTTDTAVWGDYYYRPRGSSLALRGKRQPRGQVVLDEFGSPAHSARATAQFQLTGQPDGTLVGTWRTLPPARARTLSVVLRPYRPAPSRECRVRVDEQDPAHVAVADPAVTQLLRLQLRMLVATDSGDPGTQHLEVEYADRCLLSVAVSSEMVGANVTPLVTHRVYDLRTGEALALEAELDPKQVPAFVAEANRRLQQQIARFARENTPEEEDRAGLGQQHFTRESLANSGAYIRDDSVRFSFGVAYEGMSSFISKEYTDAFAPSFSFAELQPYLLPKSKLHGLLSSPAK